MKDFWNTRYDQPDYAYGTRPNVFFEVQLDKLAPGKILLPCEGEGRNAVFAATRNWDVTAFDFSETARRKALQLAEENRVEIDYAVEDVNEVSFPENSFDAIALIYAHFPEPTRSHFHKKVAKWLAPGGTLILEAFSRDQLGRDSGGPKTAEALYTTELLKSDFGALEIQSLEQLDTSIHEGEYHSGKASIIQLIARK